MAKGNDLTYEEVLGDTEDYSFHQFILTVFYFYSEKYIPI